MKNFLYIKNKKISLIVALALLFATSAGFFYPAQTHADQSAVGTRLFYFRDNAAARASLFAHPDSIDVLAPAVYSFDVNGVLTGFLDPTIITFAKAHNIQIMPTVTNGNFDQASLTSILNSPIRETAAINQLVALAKQEGYSGWQFDFEQMNVSYKDQYTAFIQQASEAFKANGLEISVAVIAQNSNDPSTYPKNLWTNLIGVYDYAALASSTDFISIMTYDDPTSNGPVAPYAWMDQVIQYSLKYIPANKLSLGVPLYYWKWDSTTGKLVDIGGYSGLQNALVKPGAVLGFDPTEKAPFINYSSGGNIYTIWYENAESIQAKLGLITQYGLAGFSAWSLGLESPDAFNSI